MNSDPYMLTAIEEARQSLRQGNHGFGAAIIRNGTVIARTHDTEETDQDPTAHAEMNAIRAASRLLGRDLSGCLLVSTHEPCPMCATAIAWSGISALAYGYSIARAVKQGRRRIDLSCREIFAKAGASIQVSPGVLEAECAVLYDRTVRREIKALRQATDQELRERCRELGDKRLRWFETVRHRLDQFGSSALDQAHNLLVAKFGVSADEMAVVERTPERVVFHSQNFCPTLEACIILGLDTRHVCRLANEEATDRLVKQIDPRLRFTRNYDKLRPHAPYCEEIVIIGEKS